MKLKVITGRESGKILDYHQSCNDWVYVDWVTTIYSITEVAFDQEGMLYMANMDRMGQSGVRPQEFEIYTLAWLPASEPYRYAYKRKKRLAQHSAWGNIRKK